jgi:hypothetical protein
MRKRGPSSLVTLRVLLVSPLPPPSSGIGRWAVLLLGWLATKPGLTMRVVDISPRWRAVEDMKLWKRVVGGVLQPRRDAWLLPPGDRPHELADAIAALAGNPEETRRIGCEGRETALREFSFRVQGPRLMDFLNACRCS